MARTPRRPSDVMARRVAELAAEGKSLTEIGACVSVSTETVGRWLRQGDVAALYREKLNAELLPLSARALDALAKQLESSNPWVVQGAARQILTQYSEVITGEAASGLVVQVIGAPSVGMPDHGRPALDVTPQLVEDA